MKFESTNIIKKLFLTFFLIFADQLSKYLIRQSGGFYVCNSALAFGIKLNSLVFYFLWTLTVLFILYAAANPKFKISNPKQSQNSNTLNFKSFWIFNFGNFNLFRIWNFEFGAYLILSGALSNIIDRLYFGCVIDFIDIKIWPIFNLADIYITIGVILILAHLLKRKVI